MNNQQETSKNNQVYMKMYSSIELLDTKPILLTFQTQWSYKKQHLDTAKGQISTLENKYEEIAWNTAQTGTI